MPFMGLSSELKLRVRGETVPLEDGPSAPPGAVHVTCPGLAEATDADMMMTPVFKHGIPIAVLARSRERHQAS